MKIPTVLAIIVNYNGKEYLTESIPSSLAELKFCKGKLIIIDNNSSDDSIDYISTNFPEVNIIKNQSNLGGSGGFNTGMNAFLQETDFQYVWLLDNDVKIEPGALPALLSSLESEDIGAAGSQICMYDSPDVIQEVGARYTKWLGSLEQNYSGAQRIQKACKPLQVDYLAACSLLIKRECLEEVGLFRDFFISYDDVDWGLRANKKGWKIVAVPKSVIRHKYNKFKPLSPVREYYRKRNRIEVLVSHPPARGKFLASFIYLIFMNYWISLYKLSGNVALFKALRLARTDGIHGNLGCLDHILFSLESSKNQLTFEINDSTSVLFDFKNDGGAIIEIAKQMSSNYKDSVNFYCKQKGLISYFPDGLVLSSRSSKTYDIVILGQSFYYSSLFSANRIYQYCNYHFKRINSPTWHLFRDLFNRLVSLSYALLVSPFHFLCILKISWVRKSEQVDKVESIQQFPPIF